MTHYRFVLGGIHDGFLSKYKFVISISSVPYTRYLKKHKFVTRIIMYVNVLYEFMKIMISVIVICLL